jgi:hypothetical protein
VINRNARIKEQQAMRRRIREAVMLRRLAPRDVQTEPQPVGKPAE